MGPRRDAGFRKTEPQSPAGGLSRHKLAPPRVPFAVPDASFLAIVSRSRGRHSSSSPSSFDGKISELTLEAWIVDNPQLVGEPLLVLGRQLAEFEEDQDRLDVLAVDEDGEIVLVELKVTDNFRVTDLQALAYAGAYATRDPEDLVQTLRRRLQKLAEAAAQGTVDAIEGGAQTVAGEATGPSADSPDNGAAAPAPSAGSSAPEVSVDDAKQEVVNFLELDDFAEWQPSQHVRIKLVAPKFPRRGAC